MNIVLNEESIHDCDNNQRIYSVPIIIGTNSCIIYIEKLRNTMLFSSALYLDK